MSQKVDDKLKQTFLNQTQVNFKKILFSFFFIRKFSIEIHRFLRKID
jgi:hypothetical protein